MQSARLPLGPNPYQAMAVLHGGLQSSLSSSDESAGAKPLAPDAEHMQVMVLHCCNYKREETREGMSPACLRLAELG